MSDITADRDNLASGRDDAYGVLKAVRARRSCRQYLARRVNQLLLYELLDAAKCAPSGGNVQPWHVHVISGQAMDRFREMIRPHVLEHPLGLGPEYTVYPPDLGDPYRGRRFKVGEDLYRLLAISREDKPARIRQVSRNFDFFGAPVGLFFLIDRLMGPPQWADMGMFIQTFMLLARERGLDTCAQESWTTWHRQVTHFIGAPPNLMLFCGLAVGYADHTAPINQLRSDRGTVAEFATFHDQ